MAVDVVRPSRAVTRSRRLLGCLAARTSAPAPATGRRPAARCGRRSPRPGWSSCRCRGRPARAADRTRGRRRDAGRRRGRPACRALAVGVAGGTRRYVVCSGMAPPNHPAPTGRVPRTVHGPSCGTRPTRLAAMTENGPLSRPARGRPDPRAGRAAGGDDAGRPRRAGDQGREHDRRRHPRVGSALGRRGRRPRTRTRRTSCRPTATRSRSSST